MTDERKTTVFQWVRLGAAVLWAAAVLYVHSTVQAFSDIGLVAALALSGAFAGEDLRKMMGGGK
ncbi:MAG: hypothetical protein ACE37E_01295 [Hyphomicrobiales bacterium]